MSQPPLFSSTEVSFLFFYYCRLIIYQLTKLEVDCATQNPSFFSQQVFTPPEDHMGQGEL